MNNLKTYELLFTIGDKLKFLTSVTQLDSKSKAELLMIDRKLIELLPAVKKEAQTMDENTKDKIVLDFGELFYKIIGEYSGNNL